MQVDRVPGAKLCSPPGGMLSGTTDPSVTGAPSDMNSSELGKRTRSKDAADALMAEHKDLACSNIMPMHNVAPYYYILPSDVKTTNRKMHAAVRIRM